MLRCYFTVINCANRGNVTSGTVNYSGASTSNGSYPLGTVASVVCITGHQLDGEDATCTDGGIWSKDLANCSSKQNTILYQFDTLNAPSNHTNSLSSKTV